MLITHSRAFENSYGVLWAGRFSVARNGGAIESFLLSLLSSLPQHVSLITVCSDGLTDITQVDHLVKDHKNPLVAVLSTRFPISSHHPVLYLPLDDTIFSQGLLPVLASFPRIAWEQRLPTAFWRGTPSPGLPSIRSRTVETLLSTHHNVRFHRGGCASYCEDQLPDHYFGHYCDLPEQFHYKYLLILDGNQIASNHMWVFGSGAVPIMITHPDNHFWFQPFLKPMVNYVPVQYDLTDLESTLEWLQTHDNEAKSIMEGALHLAATLFSSAGQQQYLEKEVDRLLHLHYPLEPRS